MFATVIGVAGSLIQARFVTPEDLGYFRSYSIATGYAFILHLGIFGAMQRLYPFYIGKGQKEQAQRVAEICQSWNVAVSAIVSGGFVVLAVATLCTGNWRATLGWLVQAVAMAGFIYGGYLGASYRSGHDFVHLTKSSIYSSVVGLLTLPLFVLWPYVALVLKSGLTGIVSLGYLHYYRPLRIPWRFSWREWFELIKQGLPIFIADYGKTVLWSLVEVTIVLSQLGVRALGLWSMSRMVIEAAIKVPQAITSVYAPRITECYGRTESVKECMKLSQKPVLWGTFSMLGMAVCSSLVLPFIVPIIMPKYVAAISTMCLMTLTFPLMVLEIPQNLLISMGERTQQNIVAYAGLGCFSLMALGAVKLGLGINSIAGASLLGQVISRVIAGCFLYSTYRRQVDAPGGCR